MWRVVLDCATLTSALLNAHASPARLIDFALRGTLRLFTTSRMVAAEGRVLRSAALRRRHGLSDHELSSLLADLPVLLCLVNVKDEPGCSTEEADELMLCASLSHADFLVTSSPLNAATAVQAGTQPVTADHLVDMIGHATI